MQCGIGMQQKPIILEIDTEVEEATILGSK